MTDVARVQGNLVSWSSHIFKIDGVRWYGWTNIAGGSDKLERVHGYGSNRSHAPIGISAGKYTPPAPGLTGLAHTYIAFIEYLKSKAPDRRSIGKVRFNMTLQIQEGTIKSDMEWRDCQLADRQPKAEDSPDPTTREVALVCMRYIEDGTTLYDSSEEPA